MGIRFRACSLLHLIGWEVDVKVTEIAFKDSLSNVELRLTTPQILGGECLSEAGRCFRQYCSQPFGLFDAFKCVSLTHYSPENWSTFRWKVLKHGLTRNRRFIPWPDTQRLWRAHLPLDRITFLDRFLPPEEVAA